MSAGFTGERVIPAQVDADLWNEHFSRYVFAGRHAHGRRVLDAGCGAGYGAAELSRCGAAAVTGVDVAAEAVAMARSAYAASGADFLQASCTALPFAAGSFDLVVSFEVIEHLRDWRGLLAEARRVLAPGGLFLVSTPNKAIYAEARGESGPNPFHEHEFELDEFREALREYFPSVLLWTQDHTEGVLFRPVEDAEAADLRYAAASQPESSAFFLALCGAGQPETGPPLFYIPGEVNALHEKLTHIQRLRSEIATKDEWLAGQQSEHADLVQRHGQLHQELEASNRWAGELEMKLREAQSRVAALQEELAEHHRSALSVVAQYEARLTELEAELAERTRWAQETEQRLSSEAERQSRELVRCVELLHAAEAQLEERTHWALDLDRQREQLQAAVAAAEASRWVRLGRIVGLGPELSKR